MSPPFSALLEQMVVRKTVCLGRLGETRKGEERVGRFFANRKVTAEKIVVGWSTLTGAACAGRHVLLIEDRSEVRFPTTAQRRRGLGAWAAWIIARLGGWNCYYKPPGPITFRRGMEQFYAIHRGRMLEMRLQRDVRIP